MTYNRKFVGSCSSRVVSRGACPPVPLGGALPPVPGPAPGGAPAPSVVRSGVCVSFRPFGLVCYVVLYGHKVLFRTYDYSEALERIACERSKLRHPGRIRLTTAQCLPFIRLGNF